LPQTGTGKADRGSMTMGVPTAARFGDTQIPIFGARRGTLHTYPSYRLARYPEISTFTRDVGNAANDEGVDAGIARFSHAMLVSVEENRCRL
jgi:hypothetical protein